MQYSDKIPLIMQKGDFVEEFMLLGKICICYNQFLRGVKRTDQCSFEGLADCFKSIDEKGIKLTKTS